jgi:hypothetical protein
MRIVCCVAVCVVVIVVVVAARGASSAGIHGLLEGHGVEFGWLVPALWHV